MKVFKIKHFKYLLLSIIFIAFCLRFYGINWDQGHHLHPDERAIVMFALPLEIPKDVSEFLSISSPLNPQFFAYGNFPLYLLKGTGYILSNFDPLYLSYEKINLVGRLISVTADIGTLIIIFLLGRKLFNQTTGFLASFFYAVSVFPIQASHFYAVDILFTFFITLTLFQLTRLYEKQSTKNFVLTGLFFGFSLATKISAISLLLPILVAITLNFLLILLKRPLKPSTWLSHLPHFLNRFLFGSLVVSISTIITFIILQPYAIIDHQEFINQTQQMSQVTHDAFAFPFTLQYVDKTPYIYELKNFFLWGQGPVLSSFSFLGLLYICSQIINMYSLSRQADMSSNKSRLDIKYKQALILIIFCISYFLIVGKFSVGFMRYMLPIYPLLSLFGAIFVLKVLFPKIKYFMPYHFKFFNFQFFLGLLLIVSILIWPLSFMNIYTKENTRVSASDWINQNISSGKTLALEHWDDGLPLYGMEKYNIVVLELYNPDNEEKWENINNQLSRSDYIILASNRLYTPLSKLTNCNKLPEHRCYPLTAKYYNDLFSEKLGFVKVAEFSSYPKIPIFNIEINDQTADESFTVYDHPKITIFQKDLIAL